MAPARTLSYEEVWSYACPKAPVAWPTLGLFAAVVALTGIVAFGRYSLHWSSWIVVSLLTIASCAMFTVMHETVHQSVFRSRALNRLLGGVAALFMGPTACYSAYRTLHLQHHKHTNDPRLDPDYYSGIGPKAWLPFSWLTTDVHYYWFYLRGSSRRPLAEQAQVFVENALMLCAFTALCSFGYAVDALVFWALPARFASGLLAWGFNYLPHAPYTCRAEDDPYRATKVLWPESRLATVLLQGHNFHQVHHLFPGVPFFSYAKVWRRYGDALRKRQAEGKS